MGDLNYIDHFYDKVVRGLPDEELDKVADTSQPMDRLPAATPQTPSALMSNDEYLKWRSTQPNLQAQKPVEISANAQVDPIEAIGYKGDKFSYKPAEASRQNYNSLLKKLSGDRDDAAERYNNSKDLVLEKEKSADDALKKLNAPLPDFVPSNDYNAEMDKLTDENNQIQDPQRDMLSQIILSLGPAVLGAFSGESGAIAAPRAQEKAQAGYDKNINDTKAQNAILRKNIADRMQALSAAQKADVQRYVEVNKLNLDKDKATAATNVNNARFNKDNVAQEARMLQDIDKAIANVTSTGIAKSVDLEQHHDTSVNTLRAANARANSPLAEERLNEAREKSVTTDWNRATKDQTARIEAGNRVLGLISEIRSGRLVDSSNIRNTLTNDLSVLALPSGSAGALSDREKTAVRNMYTIQKDMLSFIESNPNSTIPPKYLDQMESEAKILQNKYGSALKGRYNSMLGGTKTPYKKDLYKGRYDAFMTENHMDPESGSYGGAPQAPKQALSPEQRQKMIDDLKKKGYK
jgi:hypothetical protein